MLAGAVDFREERRREIAAALLKDFWEKKLPTALQRGELCCRVLPLDDIACRRGFKAWISGDFSPRGPEDLHSEAYKKVWRELADDPALRPFIEIDRRGEEGEMVFISVLLLDSGSQLIHARIEEAKKRDTGGCLDLLALKPGMFKLRLRGPRSAEDLQHPLASWVWQLIENEGCKPFIRKEVTLVEGRELSSYYVSARIR